MSVNKRDTGELTEREREVLRLVVRSFIDTAGPVGSRYLSRHSALGLSAASIRNTMSDLEDLGYLDHPYTSAGRVPTELGYRKFVDELMETDALSLSEKQLLKHELDRLMGGMDQLLTEGTRLLGRLSNLLGVALTPKLAAGTLDRIEAVPLSSSRLMFILSVQGGLVRTIIFEVDTDLHRQAIGRVVATLNERLAGLTLQEIRETFEPRLRGIEDGSGIVRLVLNEAPVIFSENPDGRRVRYGGAQNLVLQPEFQEPAGFRDLIKMIEDEDFVVHLLEGQRTSVEEEVGRALVSIGSENADEQIGRYSVVTARYSLGETAGTIGVIGPMRMDYARVVSLVENMAALLSRPATSPERN